MWQRAKNKKQMQIEANQSITHYILAIWHLFLPKSSLHYSATAVSVDRTTSITTTSIKIPENWCENLEANRKMREQNTCRMREVNGFLSFFLSFLTGIGCKLFQRLLLVDPDNRLMWAEYAERNHKLKRAFIFNSVVRSLNSKDASTFQILLGWNKLCGFVACCLTSR